MAIIGGLLAIGRLFLFILVAVFFFCLLLVISIFYKSKERKLERGILLRRFAIRILHPILGSKITVYGKEPIDSGLIVSNHRSYFDPMVILKNNLASTRRKKRSGVLAINRKCYKNNRSEFL